MAYAALCSKYQNFTFFGFFLRKKVERNFQKWTFLKMSKSENCKKVFLRTTQNQVYRKPSSGERKYFFCERWEKIFGQF